MRHVLEKYHETLFSIQAVCEFFSSEVTTIALTIAKSGALEHKSAQMDFID